MVGPAFLALVLASAAGCEGDSIEVGAFAPLTAVGGAAGVPGSGGAATGAVPAQCEEVACNGKLYDCGNCVDDDLDGLVDSLDPECLGACDDAEDTLDAGFPGSSTSKCTMDCYFDQDSGSGNDGCEWDRRCDPFAGTGLVCADEPREDCAVLREQPASCQDVCLPLVPNGCDCFGCCNVPGPDGMAHEVYVGTEFNGVPSCTPDTIADPLRCLPCEQVASCLNPCERCELCVGKTELPADCDPTQAPQCPAGLASCGREGQPGCGPNYYCITGCCIEVPR